MALIQAGRLDGRNVGAVVSFLDSEGFTITTTMDGTAQKAGVTLIFTPLQDEPYEVESTRQLNVYLASNAKYDAQNMAILERIEDMVQTAIVVNEFNITNHGVEPMEVPC